ncbi:MAG: thioredoxin [Pseudomonadota bacterium]
METIIGANGSGSADADVIKDSSTESFARDVIEASMGKPVIVDFWAPWCGPCKQLGPALEKAVKAARGAVQMVKVNIDENQELAAQLRIQSIPTIYAFFQGRPVDGFQGALPESQIQSFVERIVQLGGGEAGPSPVDQALEQAEQALEQGQLGAASALFGQVLQHEPESMTALAGMIRCALASGDQAGAREMVDSLTDEMRDAPEMASALAALELAESAGDEGEIPALSQKVEANPGDHQARFDLAMALYAADQRERAADELLEIVRRDRNWGDEAARKQLLKFFEAWGQTDEHTLEARRRLSAILFS